MFKLVTWAIVSLGVILGLNYYNSVVRPDVNMKVAMSQFDNSDETAKAVRHQTFIQNHITTVVIGGWLLFTVLCVYSDVKEFIVDLGRDTYD